MHLSRINKVQSCPFKVIAPVTSSFFPLLSIILSEHSCVPVLIHDPLAENHWSFIIHWTWRIVSLLNSGNRCRAPPRLRYAVWVYVLVYAGLWWHPGDRIHWSCLLNTHQAFFTTAVCHVSQQSINAFNRCTILCLKVFFFMNSSISSSPLWAETLLTSWGLIKQW